MLTHGRIEYKWPSILLSADDGKTWKVIEQPKKFQPEQNCNYSEFFEWQGVVYTTSILNFKGKVQEHPWMIKFTGNKKNFFEQVYYRRNEIIKDGQRLNWTLSSPIPFKDVLLVKSNDWYLVESIEPWKAKKTSLPQGANSLADAVVRDGVAYILHTAGYPKKGKDYFVSCSSDGTTWHTLFKVRKGNPYYLSAMEVYKGDFCFAGSIAQGKKTFKQCEWFRLSEDAYGGLPKEVKRGVKKGRSTRRRR